MLTIRPAQWPQDIAPLSQLHTEMVTATIYRPIIAPENLAFRLVEEPIDPPLRKRYAVQPDSLEERRDWDCAVIAEEAGAMAGFAAAQYVAWNRRVVLWHLYVAPSFRRQGVGARLLDAIDTFAHSVEARCIWLETQNINAPAIRFYQRVGFQFCGFDTTLYDPKTLHETEIALFFARPLPSR